MARKSSERPAAIVSQPWIKISCNDQSANTDLINVFMINGPTNLLFVVSILYFNRNRYRFFTLSGNDESICTYNFFVRHFNECLLITLDNLKYYQPFKNTIRIQLI